MGKRKKNGEKKRCFQCLYFVVTNVFYVCNVLPLLITYFCKDVPFRVPVVQH